MTYKAEEISVESGQLVELYIFTEGATVTRYTSSEDSFVFNSNTYLPRQISRGSPTESSDERRQELEITLPTEDAIAQRFIASVPGQSITLQILRVHRGDTTEAFILWTGRLSGASYRKSGSQCILQGLTTESAIARPIPRFKYQGLCNHILYDSGCKIIKTDFDYVGTVTSVVGNRIEVSGLFAAEGAGWALGGFVNFNDTDYRVILAQSGDNLTLPLPFEANILNQSVTVQAGCDHTLTTCNVKFANEVNYGGYPFVPNSNIFETGI